MMVNFLEKRKRVHFLSAAFLLVSTRKQDCSDVWPALTYNTRAGSGDETFSFPVASFLLVSTTSGLRWPKTHAGSEDAIWDKIDFLSAVTERRTRIISHQAGCKSRDGEVVRVRRTDWRRIRVEEESRRDI